MQDHSLQTTVPFYQSQQMPGESFRLLELNGAWSGCSWHFHPEYQIGFVVSGSGTRVVGDDIRPIEPGEIILLGANLPHVWNFESSATGDAHAFVIHFRDDFLGMEFFNKPEMRDIRLLLARASLGLAATGGMREQAEQILRKMADHEGFDRVLHLLSLLHLMAGSNEMETICSSAFQPVAAEIEIERLRRVCDYVQTDYGSDIDRETAAALAHLSPGAFSRFFKRHTGKTFQEYVNEVRIGKAAQMLLEEELNVTQIALRCGYGDATAFNRSFRRIKEMSPSAYRDRILAARQNR